MNRRDRGSHFTLSQGRGYRPEPERLPLAAILAAVIGWLILLAAAGAFTLPLALRLVHWVLRGH